MTEPYQTAQFSRASLELAVRTPKTTSLRASSRRLGWSSILLDDLESHGNQEESWDGFATPDIKISVGLTGSHDLWAMQNGRWASAVIHAGTVNVGGSGESCRLRWRNRSANHSFRVASACLPEVMLEETADYFRRPGQRLEHRIPSLLVINDQVIAGTVRAMIDAVANDACELYAEQASRWLATHLVHAHGRAFDPASDNRNVERISDARLARVVEYIRVNLAKQMTITELAGVAGVSPFHFCRLFSSAIGLSPNRYLVDRRMQKAEALLRTTDISLNEIAGLCGYTRPNAFSVAFQRRFSLPPTAFRRACRTSIAF